MNDVGEVRKWLFGLLSGDAQLKQVVGARVFADLAPQGSVFPVVIFGLQSGGDSNTLGHERVSTQLWMVKVIGEGNSPAAVDAAVARIETLMQGAHVLSSTLVATCDRSSPIGYPEVSEGKRYSHVGGVWRIYVQGTQ